MTAAWLGAWLLTVGILLRRDTPRERKTWEAYAHGGRPWVNTDPGLARWDIPCH